MSRIKTLSSLRLQSVIFVLYSLCCVLGVTPATHAAERDTVIRVVGSDTMLVLNEAWAKSFQARRGGLRIEVEGGGSGKGIAALLSGETDLAASSREMTREEKALFERRFGSPPEELVVAADGLAIYVHRSNPLSYISLDEAAAIFEGRVRNWKEVGGRDRPIRLYIRNESSGTHAFFRDVVLKGRDYARSALRAETTPAIIEAVSRDASAVGHGGIAYARGAHILKIHAGDPRDAVYPGVSEVLSGHYPLSRPLRFYFSPGHRSDAVRAFALWTVSAEGQEVVEEVGYFGVTGVFSLDEGVSEQE